MDPLEVLFRQLYASKTLSNVKGDIPLKFG